MLQCENNCIETKQGMKTFFYYFLNFYTTLCYLFNILAMFLKLWAAIELFAVVILQRILVLGWISASPVPFLATVVFQKSINTSFFSGIISVQTKGQKLRMKVEHLAAKKRWWGPKMEQNEL